MRTAPRVPVNGDRRAVAVHPSSNPCVPITVTAPVPVQVDPGVMVAGPTMGAEIPIVTPLAMMGVSSGIDGMTMARRRRVDSGDASVELSDAAVDSDSEEDDPVVEPMEGSESDVDVDPGADVSVGSLAVDDGTAPVVEADVVGAGALPVAVAVPGAGAVTPPDGAPAAGTPIAALRTVAATGITRRRFTTSPLRSGAAGTRSRLHPRRRRAAQRPLPRSTTRYRRRRIGRPGSNGTYLSRGT